MHWIPYPRLLRHMGDHGGGVTVVGPVDRTEGETFFAYHRGQDGGLTVAQARVKEDPRMVEELLRDASPEEAGDETSRICGVCPIVHQETSNLAWRAAQGFVLDLWSTEVERFAMRLGTMQSHLAHIALFALPDWLGITDAFKRDRDPTVRGVIMFRTAITKLTSYLLARGIHPVALHPTGCTARLEPRMVQEHVDGINRSRTYVERLIETIAELPTVKEQQTFEMDTRFVALDGVEYPLDSGKHVLLGDDLGRIEVGDFLSLTREERPSYSNAYHTTINGKPYLVGALARWHHHHEKLHPDARAVAVGLGLKPETRSPLMTTVAQIVECVHMLANLESDIERILTTPKPQQKPRPITTTNGAGIGACEAPRGTLFHWQLYRHGRIVSARALIPTAQNMAYMQEMILNRLQPFALAGATNAELEQLAGEAIRALDPCFSCAVHVLDEQHIHTHHH